MKCISNNYTRITNKPKSCKKCGHFFTYNETICPNCGHEDIFRNPVLEMFRVFGIILVIGFSMPFIIMKIENKEILQKIMDIIEMIL